MFPVAAVGCSDRTPGVSGPGASGPPPPAAPQGITSWGADAVDITGMTVGEALDLFEQYRLEKIKREIAAGSYLTEHKLAVVTDRLAELIRREGRSKRASA